MPELPEAETIARDLHARITNRGIDNVRIHRAEVVEPMAARTFARALAGRRIRSVGRRGKWIVIHLDGDRYWVTQLRMTGRFEWSVDPIDPDAPHLSASIRFRGDAGVLQFYDVRRFARMWALSREEWGDIDARLGPEPLAPTFTAERLGRILQPSSAPVRNVLLDQARIAGVGNLYANEACFIARVDPRKPARELDTGEVDRIHSALQMVLKNAIERRGSSFSDYRGVDGDEGAFQSQLRVYGRADEPCSVCNATIRRAVLAGRSAFFCARCQS